MKNQIIRLLKQILKEIFLKYIICFLLGAILAISAKAFDNMILQQILVNIAGSLFALPIIFITYDVYQKILTRKQEEIVVKMSDKKIELAFIKFVFTAYRIRNGFNVITDDILSTKNDSKLKIFNDISNTKHSGFFIFSRFDRIDDEINEILDSQLFMHYAPNNIISLICEFSIYYQDLVEEFKLISKEDFIFASRLSEINFRPSSSSHSSKDKLYDVYINENDATTVIYIAGYPIYDENMLKGLYRISDTKADRIADLINKLYLVIIKWEKDNGKSLTLDNCMFSAGRLCKHSYINMHGENNIAIETTWY